MYTALWEEVAALRYQELIARGLHEQFVASVLPPSASTPEVLTVLRHQLGTILVRAGQRLQGVHVAESGSLRSVAAGQPGTIA